MSIFLLRNLAITRPLGRFAHRAAIPPRPKGAGLPCGMFSDVFPCESVDLFDIDEDKARRIKEVSGFYFDQISPLVMNGKVLTAEMLERIASHLDDFGEMTPGELAYCGFVMGILATKIDTDMSISMLKFMHSMTIDSILTPKLN